MNVVNIAEAILVACCVVGSLRMQLLLQLEVRVGLLRVLCEIHCLACVVVDRCHLQLRYHLSRGVLRLVCQVGYQCAIRVVVQVANQTCDTALAVFSSEVRVRVGDVQRGCGLVAVLAEGVQLTVSLQDN